MVIGPDRAHFDGSDYDPERDDTRLTGQLLRVFEVMADGQWRTIDEIEALTGDPKISIQSQLRHLRKERFGAYDVPKRRRGGEESNLWEYRVGARGAHVPKANDARLKLAEAREQIRALEHELDVCYRELDRLYAELGYDTKED